MMTEQLARSTTSELSSERAILLEWSNTNTNMPTSFSTNNDISSYFNNTNLSVSSSNNNYLPSLNVSNSSNLTTLSSTRASKVTKKRSRVDMNRKLEKIKALLYYMQNK